MLIKNLFPKDKAIDRAIEGVVKIAQNEADDSALQEVREYVITQELQRHFDTFFSAYKESFRTPPNEVGVWISGFFGSGKSHFLKMLSYLVSNREIGGRTALEHFRAKFAGCDAVLRANIETCCTQPTETILFNIDTEAIVNADAPILRVFAKVFYRMRGYYGDATDIALLEQELDDLGKLQQFEETFNSLTTKKKWKEARRSVNMHMAAAVPALMHVLGVPDQEAREILRAKRPFSIDTFIQDVKRYVDSKPADYHLLFMVDEVGQYLGADVNRLLNLQTITENLSKACHGKVWVVCTAQDALELVVDKLKQEQAHGRIQDRFPLRLSLTSSSVEEVIQKRLLEKTPEASDDLQQLYRSETTVLENLFAFHNASSLHGYSSAEQFAKVYPFVPYQFSLLQAALIGIRKHGQAGVANMAHGERSMLAGFQEAACARRDESTGVLIPFYLFYEKLHRAMDPNVRLVVERATIAATEGNGLTIYDVNVLKLLFLICYVDIINSTLDNIVILMAEHINEDMVELRRNVQASLDRLFKEHYISMDSKGYHFLTNEEQDVENEIRNTLVEDAEVIESIRSCIQGEICNSYRYSAEGVSFRTAYRVDNQAAAGTADLSLWFRTDAMETRTPVELAADSQDCALLALKDTGYYEMFKTAKQLDIYQMTMANTHVTTSKRGIIAKRLSVRNELHAQAKDALDNAIRSAVCYVNGSRVQLRGTALSCVATALEALFKCSFSNFEHVSTHYRSAGDVQAMLRNLTPIALPNKEAADDIEQWVRLHPGDVAMQSIIDHFHNKPYGWSETDSSAIVASLSALSRMEIRRAGRLLKHTEKDFCQTLLNGATRKQLAVSWHQQLAPEDLQWLRAFVDDYCHSLIVEQDEAPFFDKLRNVLREQLAKFAQLCNAPDFPGQASVGHALKLLKDLNIENNDNQALLAAIRDKEDALLDSAEEMEEVEKFHIHQRPVYQRAKDICELVESDPLCLEKEQEASAAMDEIREILTTPAPQIFRLIPKLPPLVDKVGNAHDRLLDSKRAEIEADLAACLKEIHAAAKQSPACQKVSDAADESVCQLKQKCSSAKRICALEPLRKQIANIHADALTRIDAILNPSPTPVPHSPVSVAIHQFKPKKPLRSAEDIDTYLSELKVKLSAELDKHADRGISLY